MTCPSDGLLDGVGYQLKMSDAAGSIFTKLGRITALGAAGSSSVGTDDVQTLDDVTTVPVPVGVFTVDPIAVTILMTAEADPTRENLHNIYRAKDCRKWQVVAPDGVITEFCGSITDWKPNTDKDKKGRVSFTLTPSGDYKITDSSGQIYPVTAP